jgi:hypothetical protein
MNLPLTLGLVMALLDPAPAPLTLPNESGVTMGHIRLKC